ncbi:hypothetical protein [Halorussus sp. MSC15.2]|nr:hypothetical protein [Halorussus sp. MSC15.2]
MIEKSDIADWLADNPKMMGVLWTLMIVVTETGSLIDSTSVGTAGP